MHLIDFLPFAVPAAEVPLAAIAVPPVSVLTLVAILTIVIVIIAVGIRKKAKRTINQEEVYYSEVGPPSLPIRTNKNTSYKESTTLQGLQTKTVKNMQPMTNRSPHMLSDGMQNNPNIAIGLNPAYGTDIALAPDIEAERNEAYTSNTCQTTPDRFIMAANSAYGIY